MSEPDSSFAESTRTLRANIIQLVRRGVKTYLVTSCWEGEGKTSVCINLGAALAEFGLRVLLWDGDLRGRSLTHLLGQGLEGSGIRKSEVLPGVCFSPACLPEQERAADYLARPSYRDAFVPHLAEFDVVLVDSPPLSVCSDAHILGRMTDGALLVTSSDKFRGLAEGHYSEDLRDNGIDILGVVITGK